MDSKPAAPEPEDLDETFGRTTEQLIRFAADRRGHRRNWSRSWLAWSVMIGIMVLALAVIALAIVWALSGDGMP